MDNLTPAQQAVVNALMVSGSGLIPKEGIHTLTIKALLGEGIIEAVGDQIKLTEEACAEFCTPAEEVDTPPPVIDIDGEGEDVVEAKEVLIHQTVTLRDAMTIQVDHKGKMVTIPAGTIVPVLSWHTERTRKHEFKWFSVIFPPTMTIFQVSSLRNTSTPIEPTPLTDFV